MNSGQNAPISIHTPTFSFSREVKVSLGVVLACHLLLIGWIGFGGNEPNSDITSPMTGMLLSEGSGTGTGVKGAEKGTPEVAGGSPGMEKQYKTDESVIRKEKRQAVPTKAPSDTKPVKNSSSSPLFSPEKNTASTSGKAMSTSATSSKGNPATATGTGVGSGHGTGSGTDMAGDSGKGGTGFSGPYSDAGFFSNPKPPYPAVSRRMNEEGIVLLSVHILADGRVDEVRLKRSSGFSRLDDSAMKTVRHWRYVPAKRNGKPIPYWYAQPIRFSLDD